MQVAHWGFIAAAYAAAAIAVAGLVLRAVLDHRAQVNALAELERRGVARRSDRSAAQALPATGQGSRA